ncbi:glycosyltransferase family 1 protein [Fortiea sp. LEGE XX443]|uniref:glycosyltransferase family protein n=1 Tax=Fortiea sp. LEGE XX443 TaxID=1828611 RepID=UPI00187FB599|nr:glycosyltransferase [Fortiea sp. LEGE XX443]MBE9005332.1 glycosyltransferase family 1 protein [Fortiea sp. LEGE XX443]
MRIFLSCLQSQRQHPVPAYQFWETYFKNGIEEAQHEWVEAKKVDWAEGLVYLEKEALREWRDRTWNLIISSIKQHHQTKPIDLFLAYLFPKQVEPRAIQEIKALGIPCVNFFCDNVREFTRIPKEFYCFDLHWVPEFKALKMYQQAGLNYIYAPMPVWIPPHQRNCNHPENYGVSFIGSRDIQREVLLAQVLKSDIPIEIRGAGWSKNTSTLSDSSKQHQNILYTAINQLKFVNNQGITAWVRKIQAKSLPRISDDTFSGFIKKQPNTDEYPAIIQQSTISLGINRYPSYQYSFFKPNTYSRMRDIEAPMMGACYLTEWTEGLDHLYELGEEIETYRSCEELIEKIRILKASPEKRNKLRCRGQKRALTDHTLSTSLNKISSSLGLNQ